MDLKLVIFLNSNMNIFDALYVICDKSKAISEFTKTLLRTTVDVYRFKCQKQNFCGLKNNS